MLIFIFCALFASAASVVAETHEGGKTLEVIGGRPSPPTPFQVSIQNGSADCKEDSNYILQRLFVSPKYWANADNHRHWCGGIIVSSRIILTAAHCVYDIPVTRLSVVAGLTYIKDPPGSNRYCVYEVVSHYDYVDIPNRTSIGDLAMLLLKRALDFSNPALISIADFNTHFIEKEQTFNFTG